MIAKHIMRLTSLCTHIPTVCGYVEYAWLVEGISSGRALFGAVWTDEKPEMWGWCGLGHADCTELAPGLIKFSIAACLGSMISRYQKVSLIKCSIATT